MTKPLMTVPKQVLSTSTVISKGNAQMEDHRSQQYAFTAGSVMPDGNGGFTPCPELLTEEELIRLLRVPEISKATDFHNVISHLRRYHGLPCIHICRQPLYPATAVVEWVKKRIENEGK